MAQAVEEERLAPRPGLRMTGQILALVREHPGEPLQVEVKGTRYRRLADIEDQRLRRQVVDSALELVRFTGVLSGERDSLASLEETYSWREDIRKGSQADLERIQVADVSLAEQTTTTPAPAEVEEKFLNLLTELGQTPAAPERPGLVSSIQHTLRPKLMDPDLSRSFVDDIEGIIQRRVQLIPALVGRDLHIRSGEGDSILFVFEGKEYQKLDDLPNLTARQLVKDAIREWDETT
jgi:hypothetical protein